ncbi:MAG: conjugal transfer protein TraG N-terminal domain-containing protein [Thermodesulfobacteriota bacterium]
MEVEIWCIGDLNYFVAVLNSLAMIAQSGLFQDLIKLGLILAVLVMAIEAAFMGGNMQGGLPWGRFIIALVLFKFMFANTATVWVYDTYSLKTMQVDNVPYGVAYAGSFTSKVAHEITDILEQAFSTPTMMNDGFAAPLQTLMKTRNLSQGLGKIQNGNVQKTLVQYVQDCTSVGINLGQISMDNLIYQENPWQAMKFDSGIYTTMTWLPGDPAGGTARTCSDAWSFIDNYLSGNLWDDWQGYLKTVFCENNDISCVPQQKVQNALDAMVTVSQNAQYYMMSSVLLPALDQGQINANSIFGKSEMSVIIGQAREQRNAQWVAQSSLFANIVRPLMAFFEGFLYAVTPFMALLVAFVPSGIKLIFKFFAMFIWIQMWMPVMAVLNHYLQIIMQQKLTGLVVDAAIPLTSIQGQLMGMSTINDWLATAGMLASSTPAISLALLYGGAITMTHLAGRLQHGDFINEKIARPDVVQPGAVVGMPPIRQQIGEQTAGGLLLHSTPGFQDGQVEYSQVNSQNVASKAAEMTSWQQSFGKATQLAVSRGDQGIFGRSGTLSSSHGWSASSGEGLGTVAGWSAVTAQKLGLDQTDTQKFIAGMAGAVKGEMGPSGNGASAKAAVDASLKSQFDSAKAQKLTEDVSSLLKLDGGKNLKAAIDEKWTSMAASGELRQHQNIFDVKDIDNVENAAKKMQQSQQEFSSAESMARQQGARQAVPFMAIATAMQHKGVTPDALMKMDRERFHGSLLPPGKVAQEAGWFKRLNRHTTEKDARMWGIVSTLNKQALDADPKNKVVADASRKLLMDYMPGVGMSAKDAGGAFKFQGLTPAGEVEKRAKDAETEGRKLPGAGDARGAIRSIDGQIEPPKGRGEVEQKYQERSGTIRSQQEEQRLQSTRDQHGKMLDDTIRESELKKSSSQSVAEVSKGVLQGLDSGGRAAFLSMVKGGLPLGEAKKVWDREAGQVWGQHFQKGKDIGLDDNFSKVYAHGAMYGWGIAAKEHAGLSLPMPKEYAADRAQAIQARSQYLQEQGYSPEAARHRAEQEVFLVEKAGQTGMNNWAERIVTGNKMFSQAHETRWQTRSTFGSLQQYEPFIGQAAQRYGVDQNLVRSVMKAESGGNPRAVSPKGATGLMQIMPDTAPGLARQLSADFNQTVTKDMVLNNSFWNIMAGTKYLSQNLRQFGSPELAVSAYHRGPEAVAKGARPGPKNRAYVEEVMGNYNAAKQRVM